MMVSFCSFHNESAHKRSPRTETKYPSPFHRNHRHCTHIGARYYQWSLTNTTIVALVACKRQQKICFCLFNSCNLHYSQTHQLNIYNSSCKMIFFLWFDLFLCCLSTEQPPAVSPQAPWLFLGVTVITQQNKPETQTHSWRIQLFKI